MTSKYHTLKKHKVITLFSSSAISTRTDATRTYEYVFEIPPMELSKNAKMSLIYLASVNSAANTVYTLRCKEISQHNSWDNKLGWGVLYSQQGLNMIQLNMGNIYHYLSEINLNSFTISISDSLINRDAGISTASNINFVLQLRLFDEDDEEVHSKFMGEYRPNNVPPQTTGLFKLIQ